MIRMKPRENSGVAFPGMETTESKKIDWGESGGPFRRPDGNVATNLSRVAFKEKNPFLCFDSKNVSRYPNPGGKTGEVV